MIATIATIPPAYIDVPGIYFFNYTVRDPSGNARTATREVVILGIAPPSITININNIYSMEVNTVDDPHSIPTFNATARDYSGNSIPLTGNAEAVPGLTITHDINPDLPGIYTVTFTAIDSEGLVRVETMKFTVTHSR